MTEPEPQPSPIAVDVRQMCRELDRLRHANPPPPAEVLEWIDGVKAWLAVLYPDIPPPEPPT